MGIGFLDAELLTTVEINSDGEFYHYTPEEIQAQANEWKPGGGWIGFYRLDKWFESVFTKEEQDVIAKHAGYSLRNVEIEGVQKTKVYDFLETCAFGMMEAGEYDIAEKFVREAERRGKNNPIFLHFLYGAMISRWYKLRNALEDAIDKTVEYCKKQIDLAPRAAEGFKKEHIQLQGTEDGFFLPIPHGYKQLSIIYDKQKKWEEAIAICRQALEQGWGGDWENRIRRYTNKLEKERMKKEKAKKKVGG